MTVAPELLKATADRLIGLATNGYRTSSFHEPLYALWVMWDTRTGEDRGRVFAEWADQDTANLDLAEQIGALLPAKPPPPPRIVVHTFAEAMVKRAPPAWVVEGMFTAGSLNVLYGLPGSCKTWLAVELCICVGLGKAWLGRATTQGAALYVDEEMGDYWLGDRLRRVGLAHQADAALPVHYATLQHLDLRTAADLAALAEVVACEKPLFVVVDPLADVMPGGDENSVQDVQPLMRGLRKLADDYQCCVVILHHPNKAGQFRGSSAIHGAVDAMFAVETDQATRIVTVKSKKMRHGGSVDFQAEAIFDPIDESFHLELVNAPPGAAAAPTGPKLAPSRQFVINHLQAYGPSTLDDLERHASAHKPGTIRQAIRELLDLGLIERTNSGSHGTQAIYGLVP